MVSKLRTFANAYKHGSVSQCRVHTCSPACTRVRACNVSSVSSCESRVEPCRGCSRRKSPMPDSVNGYRDCCRSGVGKRGRPVVDLRTLRERGCGHTASVAGRRDGSESRQGTCPVRQESVSASSEQLLRYKVWRVCLPDSQSCVRTTEHDHGQIPRRILPNRQLASIVRFASFDYGTTIANGRGTQ